MDKVIDGKELGPIVVRKNLRAKRYSLRVVEGTIIATIPKRGKESEMLSFIDAKRERLKKMLAKNRKKPLLNEDCRIKTCTFELHIFRTQRTNIYISLKEGVLHIACPEDIDFNNEQIQQQLWAIVTKMMQIEAKRILPKRLAALALQHGLQYSGVTIRQTRTRWGSCSSKKRISLSSSLMLLPDHLIEYVLLHELCHTVEMNHSERFWSLLNKVANGKARELRKELRKTTERLEVSG
jgi:predicted metal-dependent hydrolase